MKQIFVFVLLLLFPNISFAIGVGSGVGDGLCFIAAAFQGEIAAGIATIAICTIGALACVGRVQWTTAILVGVGIAVLFGANTLITLTTNLALLNTCGHYCTARNINC